MRAAIPAGPVIELLDEWQAEADAGEWSLAHRLAASGYWQADSASRLIWRIRHESDRVEVGTVDKLLVAMDDYRCAEDLVGGAAVEGDTCERRDRHELVREIGRPEPPVIRPRRVKRLSKAAKLSESQLVAIHKLHVEGGLSLREICRRGWQGWGYASERSALNSVCDLLKLAGLQARDRIEATQLASTTHGLRPRTGYRSAAERREHLAIRRSRRRRQRCAGSCARRHGERCQRFALDGSSYCLQHDPRERERVLVIAAHARAVRDA